MASVLRRGQPLASPSRSLFPWCCDHVWLPLLLMRRCRWPTHRRGAVVWLLRFSPPSPFCLSFPWWHLDRVCLPLWGSGRGGVDVFLAPQRAGLALRHERPLPPPPPKARHSPGFPPPRSTSPWRREHVRLSPSRRRSGRCEASDFVLSPRGWGYGAGQCGTKTLNLLPRKSFLRFLH